MVQIKVIFYLFAETNGLKPTPKSVKLQQPQTIYEVIETQSRGSMAQITECFKIMYLLLLKIVVQ